uniref:HDC16402 n=1 Tax=Drosophila melanogaster TaxID=7227 RepID=Q6IIZ9_DROME|nr:TPA_inf: HDC16402 [Drosophila melanogaster]
MYSYVNPLMGNKVLAGWRSATDLLMFHLIARLMQLSIYWNLRHAVALTMVFPREKESGWMDLGGWAAEGLGQLKLARVAGNTLKFIKFFVRRKHNISALWPTSGHKFVIFHFHLASLGSNTKLSQCLELDPELLPPAPYNSHKGDTSRPGEWEYRDGAKGSAGCPWRLMSADFCSCIERKESSRGAANAALSVLRTMQLQRTGCGGQEVIRAEDNSRF